MVVIGLDAFDPSLATELAAAGRLPTIARLLSRGAVASTRNPYGLFVGATWPTFFTAREPTRTGFHTWEEIAAGTYERRLTSPRDLGAEPFWRAVSDAGMRVAVADVPHARAGRELNGVEISEWGCHDRHFGFRTYPPELAREIEARHGLHPVFGIDAYAEREFAPDDYFERAGERRTVAEEKRLTEAFLAGIRAKRDLTIELVERHDADLVVSVFGESHAAGHQLWHAHDPNHPLRTPEHESWGRDPLVDVYTELDGAVGEVLERVPGEGTVLVLLSHGMAPHYDATHMLHEILRRLDAHDRGRPGEPSAPGPARRALLRLPAGVRRRARRPLAALARAEMNRRGRGEYWAFDEDRWSEQRFFHSPNNTVYGGIRINLAGREPAGLVAPGAEYERVCDQLRSDLLELVDVETGDPVVAEVTRTDEHYERRELDALPDLFVDWHRSSQVESVWSAKTGLVRATYRHWRSGDHRLDGLLLATGGGLEPGEREPLRLLDLGPSVCSRLGVELDDVDGRPVEWLAASEVAAPAPRR